MRIVSIVLGILGSIALFVGTLVVFLGAGMAGLAGEGIGRLERHRWAIL